jgi:hypothetical protein
LFFYILQKNFVGEDQREGRKTNKCDNQLREIEISGEGGNVGKTAKCQWWQNITWFFVNISNFKF